MLMIKAERNDDKERLQRLRNFIEYLSKKDAVRCRKIAKNIESSHANFAELCIQQFSEMQTLKKEHTNRLDFIKTLKSRLKALQKENIRIKEAKGLNLVTDKAASNTIMIMLEMIQKGFYIEAQQKCNFRYTFIQDLVEYTSLKSIASKVANHQQASELVYRDGKQYTAIRKFLLEYQEKVDSHEKEVQEYLKKIERGELGQWGQPDNISHQLFKLLQRIQFRIVNLENQNRELRRQIIDANNGYQDDIQEPLLVSSNSNKRYNQCPQRIISKLRALTLYIQNNSKECIDFKSPEQCLKEIQSELSNLQQYKNIMSKNPNNKEDMCQINIMMESMSERVRHLERLQEKGLDIMRTINRSIESLVKGESKSVPKKTTDHDQLYTTIEWNLEVLKRQIEDTESYYKRELLAKDRERQEQLASIQEQRDLAKNSLETMNLNQSIFQAHEQFGLQYKKSERSESYEILQDRLRELEIQKDKIQQTNFHFQSLIRELREQNINLRQKIIDDELSIKAINEERFIFTKQLEDKTAVLKNQLKKIKSLEQQSKISRLSSKKSESMQSILVKSTGQKDCQECHSLTTRNKELDTTLGNLQKQITSITETLDKTTNEKKELDKKIEDLIKQNNEATKRLNAYKRQFQDQSEQINTLNKMLTQLQVINEELENKRPKSPSSSAISKSTVISSIICEKDLADEIEEYKTKNKELKKRISQLEAKNLKEMQYTMSAKKESQAIKKKNQQIKKSLLNLEIQLDQQKEQKEKLKRLYEKLKLAFDKKNLQKSEPPKREQILFQEFMKQPSSQHRCLSHLFTAKDIFQFDEPQRLHLINILQQQCGPIYQTKLLFHFDPLNRVNFHRYIDNKRHIVTIMKTEYNRIVAAYCESYFSINGTEFGNGFLMPLWDHSSVFRIQKGKKANAYDDYYLLYGNSEIRIRSQQNRVFSNFGISNGYFDSQKKKVQDLLGENQREMNLITYEIYTVIFQRDRD